MNGLIVFATVAVAFGVLSALFVLWTTRRRAGAVARRTRYNMWGTVAMGVAFFVAVFLQERLGIIPFLGILAGLFGLGSFFLNKAGRLEP